MCPAFDLSLWLALNEEMTMLGGPLFPGSNQQFQFNKLFWSFLNEHSQLVHACDCDPDLLGVHSFRKRALTFLSSGWFKLGSASIFYCFVADNLHAPLFEMKPLA
jgi:hypothetical protein